MSATIFVDTTVLVYVRDGTEKAKQARAAEWLGSLWESRRGRLSLQVLREYYVTTTRKLANPLSPEDARDDVLAFGVWRPVQEDLGQFEHAWRLQDRFGLSWWDALIVASAHASGCAWLLSEDLQDGQDLDGVIVVNPFRHELGAVLDGV
jgi:predicted nucleic acid-binding protein